MSAAEKAPFQDKARAVCQEQAGRHSQSPTEAHPAVKDTIESLRSHLPTAGFQRCETVLSAQAVYQAMKARQRAGPRNAITRADATLAAQQRQTANNSSMGLPSRGFRAPLQALPPTFAAKQQPASVPSTGQKHTPAVEELLARMQSTNAGMEKVMGNGMSQSTNAGIQKTMAQRVSPSNATDSASGEEASLKSQETQTSEAKIDDSNGEDGIVIKQEGDEEK